MIYARGKKWPKEAEAKLVLCSGERYKDLAKEWGISVNAVSHHARKMGIFKFKWGKHTTEAEPESGPRNDPKPKILPAPARCLDLMHNGNYVPPPSICPREGALDYKLCPSRQPEAAAVYHDRSHP